MATFQKIVPNLWFDTQAEEAVHYYMGIFKDSEIGPVSYFGKAGFEHHQMPEGLVMTIEFKISGQWFTALNGGPVFKFSEAVSFIVNCDDQEEVDYYWEKLKEGGDPRAQQCGWLKDKFGVSWQIVPTEMIAMCASKETEKKERVIAAMMEMKKLNLAELRRAYEGSN